MSLIQGVSAPLSDLSIYVALVLTGMGLINWIVLMVVFGLFFGVSFQGHQLRNILLCITSSFFGWIYAESFSRQEPEFRLLFAYCLMVSFVILSLSYTLTWIREKERRKTQFEGDIDLKTEAFLNYYISDTNVHNWEIDLRHRRYFYFFITMIDFAVTNPLLIVGCLYGLAAISPENSLYLVNGAILVFIVIIGIAFYKSRRTKANRVRATRQLPAAFNVILAFYAYIFIFESSLIADGFEGPTSSQWQWLLFILDNFLKVLLLDTLEIFSLKFSAIRPQTDWSKVIVFGLNLVFTYGAVRGVLRAYSERFKPYTFQGTAWELYGKLGAMRINKEHRVRKIGHYQPADDNTWRPLEHLIWSVESQRK